MQKHPQAEFVPGAGEMLVERRVGRGRIVVSSFRLSDREFAEWPGCDEVFSAMLLHHPPRKYTVSADGQPTLDWTDGGHRLDAGRTTALRYFVRDAGVAFDSYGKDAIEKKPPQPNYAYAPPSYQPEQEDQPPGPGVAAWNDFNSVAQAARKTLRSAARIEIPNSSFVLWVLAVYLVVLVPANWTVFRSLRRIEWAWAAAPVIALICTGVVIRLAQLDIGFARSQTEVAVVEIQGEYPRAPPRAVQCPVYFARHDLRFPMRRRRRGDPAVSYRRPARRLPHGLRATE